MLEGERSLTASTPGEAQPQISYSATGKKESHMSRNPAAMPQLAIKHLMKALLQQKTGLLFQGFSYAFPACAKALLHFDVQSSRAHCGLRLV